VVFGLVGGYIDSTLTFTSGGNSLHYTGGTVGVTATYMDRGFFLDGLLKADLLNVGLNLASLQQFGFNTGSSVPTRNLGGIGNLGYRFVKDSFYAEPAVKIAYVQSTIGSINSLGTNVTIPTGQSLRGAAGLRLGAVATGSSTHDYDFSITGRFWEEFSSTNGAVFSSTGPAFTLTDPHSKTFIEVIGMLDIANKGVGWSGFVNGGAQFNKDFTTITAKAGARNQW
jgi:hypothetical protein